MELIAHRINEIKDLLQLPVRYGCEIDIRTDGSQLILHHDPFKKGDALTDYLDNYKHGTLVLNIKESGIEDLVLEEVRKREISSFFLLDVEFPYLFQASRKEEKSIAVRFSEEEPIEAVNVFSGKVDWVWIDTITKLPLEKNTLGKLNKFKTCLVCPERWGRPEDIPRYAMQMKNIAFTPNAIMTSTNHISDWERLI